MKIVAELGRSAPARTATTLSVAGSPLAGGTRKRPTGYAIAAAVDTKPTESSASRNVRRSNAFEPTADMVVLSGVITWPYRSASPVAAAGLIDVK